MDFSIITWDIFLYLLKGAGMSLLIAVISVTAGTILGTLGAIARLSHNKVANIIAAIYVEVLRGTPMLMQITFAFLALPAIIRMIIGHPIRFDPLVTGIVAIGLNSGAYTTELIRSGINGVDHGQFEAADTLGLSYKQKMKMVILPQAFKNILPPLVSEFITLIKDSSLLSTIGVVELMKSATTVGANYYAYLPPLTVASGIYLVLNLIISTVSRILERRLAVSD
ncbi:MAG: amino acid ABC transporter permease [Erysipelotrichaceae bacterium]|nr:amino acid ABC transporter permease [Erysipelotrichaceae bacterium]